jgi:hypothetical protein
MDVCECLRDCSYLRENLSSMPTIARLLKEMYCEKDMSQCARYVVYKAVSSEEIGADLSRKHRYEKVMSVLSPNDNETAEAFIREFRA